LGGLQERSVEYENIRPAAFFIVGAPIVRKKLLTDGTFLAKVYIEIGLRQYALLCRS